MESGKGDGEMRRNMASGARSIACTQSADGFVLACCQFLALVLKCYIISRRLVLRRYILDGGQAIANCALRRFFYRLTTMWAAPFTLAEA